MNSPQAAPLALNAASLGVPIVDTHSHVIAQDEARYPRMPLGGKASDWSRERPASAQDMLRAMHTAGVAQSVLVQASTCYGHDNAVVLHAVQAQPQRFIGVYSVDPIAADAVQRVQHWARAGLAGLRLFVAGHTTANEGAQLDDPRSFAVWEHAAAHAIPICVQIRAQGLPQLEVLLKRFPTVTVLLDHFARPVLEDGPPYAQAAGLLALARYPQLNFKFTTHNVREAAQGLASQASFCEMVVNAFGAERIAWGSNFPASAGSLQQQLNEALQATSSLSLQAQRSIFSLTARRLYPSLGPAPAKALNHPTAGPA